MKRAFTGFIFPIAIVVVAVWMMLRLSSGGAAESPTAFAESLTLEQATARSSDSGKPVLVFATADWCAPCQALKRSTLADPRVNEVILERTEPVYLDMTNIRTDRSQAELAQRLGVPGFPTLLLMRDGQVLSRQGPIDAGRMIAWLETY